MPDHPQHKFSPLILIGFAALLALLAPACVGSARIAELVNQRVSDEGIVRFEIDIHRSIFEREMFRLCHAPQGSSKYRCVPLAKSVQDGRFILTVDGKRDRVEGIVGWASCILHESSRHCEKIDIAPTRERLSELKRAEQQRIAQEAEANRLESLRAQEAAEEARREAEAARQEAAREQAAREEEERQRARDREELERAIREDRCTLHTHAKSEDESAYINVYECEAGGLFCGGSVLIEENGRIIYRHPPLPDDSSECSYGSVQAVAQVHFSRDSHVDLLVEYTGADSHYMRIRINKNGTHAL